MFCTVNKHHALAWRLVLFFKNLHLLLHILVSVHDCVHALMLEELFSRLKLCCLCGPTACSRLVLADLS